MRVTNLACKAQSQTWQTTRLKGRSLRTAQLPHQRETRKSMKLERMCRLMHSLWPPRLTMTNQLQRLKRLPLQRDKRKKKLLRRLLRPLRMLTSQRKKRRRATQQRKTLNKNKLIKIIKLRIEFKFEKHRPSELGSEKWTRPCREHCWYSPAIPTEMIDCILSTCECTLLYATLRSSCLKLYQILCILFIIIIKDVKGCSLL